MRQEPRDRIVNAPRLSEIVGAHDAVLHDDTPVQDRPLVVELDGTLVRTNLIAESVMLLVRHAPIDLVRLLRWLGNGAAFAKARLARAAPPDVDHLPYDRELIDYLDTQRRGGRRLVLASAADTAAVEGVARHVGLFDHVIASDGTANLSREQMQRALVDRYGERGYEYIGGARTDPSVWVSAHRAFLARADQKLRARLPHNANVELLFERRIGVFFPLLRSMRPQQWLKNTLLFLPLVTAHDIGSTQMVVSAAIGFVAFSLAASGAYLLNDLLDLPDDRRHPDKRLRPLAAGDLSFSCAGLAAGGLATAAFAAGAALPTSFSFALAMYCTLTVAYSLRLRNTVLADVLVLAALYTIRVVAGAAATGLVPTTWLLAFCMFLFLSLALVKRYGELVTMHVAEGPRAHAHGYVQQDKELIVACGVASGYLSVLVLALYISSAQAREHYADPQFIWGICTLMIYWITHIWLAAHRGRMPHGDPLSFAIADPMSRTLIALMATIFVVAL